MIVNYHKNARLVL